MKKLGSGKIRIKDIKFLENSRLRGVDDVADLMRDMELHGQLMPIGIRKSDNAIIYGNRRVNAAKKLGWDTIACEFYDDVSDDDLLFLNVIENIKRKNIGSIEIGRICHILKEKKGYTATEIAAKLSITKDRVNGCINAYNITKGTPFEKLITYGKIGANTERGIPENTLWVVQGQLTRVMGKMSPEQWNLILKAIEDGRLTSDKASTLKDILIFMDNKDLKKALDMLGAAKAVRLSIIVKDEELSKIKSKNKISTDSEMIRQIIKNYNKDLLF